jgi:hypothetical protein
MSALHHLLPALTSMAAGLWDGYLSGFFKIASRSILP